MESSTLTNLFAVARVVLSFVFEEPCFVRTVISSLLLQNSLPKVLSSKDRHCVVADDIKMAAPRSIPTANF